MYSTLGSLLCLGMLAGAAPPPSDGLDAFLTRWECKPGQPYSLVVEYVETRKDPVFGDVKEWTGTIKLLRTSNGEEYASLECTCHKPKGKKALRERIILIGRTLYSVNEQVKVKTVFKTQAPDTAAYLLATFTNPAFVALLGKQATQENYQVAVTARDEWYTYLRVKRTESDRRPEWLGWWDSRWEGRVVFQHKKSEGRPRNAPVQGWRREINGLERTWAIKKWQTHPANALTPKDFEKPESWAGWNVVDIADLWKPRSPVVPPGPGKNPRGQEPTR
jgi:hypothetical protein